jgi:type I restriction enzyme S subunit
MISRSTVGGHYPIEPLGEVVDFLDHLRRPVTESERKPGPYPYYGANGQQGTIDGFIFNEPLVLLAEDGGHFNSPERGIAYRISGKTWVNNHAHILKPRDGLDLNFLCRVLENYDVSPYVTGTTRGKLTKSGASEILVPLPSFDEQRRIAAILDAADAVRAKRRTTLAKLDTLAQSIFIEMFGDPVTNPKGWAMTSLVNLLSLPLRNGLSPSVEGLIQAKVLTLSAVTGDFFNAAAWKVAPFVTPPPDEQRVRTTDLLICRGNGNLRLVGKGYFPNEDMKEVTFPDTIIAARIDSDKIAPRFLEILWNSPATRRQIEALARTTNGTFKVNQGMLEKIRLLSPPLSAQRKFTDRLLFIARNRNELVASLRNLEALFASLQHRAFRGEL